MKVKTIGEFAHAHSQLPQSFSVTLGSKEKQKNIGMATEVARRNVLKLYIKINLQWEEIAMSPLEVHGVIKW